MAVIDLTTGQVEREVFDPNDPERRKHIINLDTGMVLEQPPGIEGRIDATVHALGGTPEDAAAIKTRDMTALSPGFTEQEATEERRALLQTLVADLATFEEQARAAGVQPGVAIPPEQQTAIREGRPIEPLQPTLREGPYQRKPPGESGPYMTGTGQGLLNIGSGVLRAYGALAEKLGDPEALQYLQDLEISQTMEQGQTGQITEKAPVRGFLGEVTGETIGFPYGGSGNSLLTRLLTSAFGGGTNAGLSSAGRGDDPATVIGQTGVGATLGPFAEGGSMGVQAYRTGRKAAELGGVQATDNIITEAADQIDEAQNSMRGRQTRLLPAQQTLDPFQLEQQAFLGSNPEVSRKAFNVLKQQNKEVAADVANLLNQIAPPESVGTSGARARKAATKVIDQAKKARRDAASPLYTKAWKAGADVDVTPVLDLADNILADLPPKGGKIRSTVKKAAGLLEGKEIVDEAGEVIGTEPLTLRQLHGAKMEIDEMIAAKGEKGLGPTTKRYLVQLQTALVKQMKDASGEYKAAAAKFAELSPPVTDLMDGVFGRLSKLKDTDLRRASALIFDAAETNPAVLTNTIRTLKSVEGGDEILQGLLRTELEKRLGKLRSGLDDVASTGGRNLENTPAHLLSKLFGNAGQKDLLMTALRQVSPEAGRNAKWLEIALERASAGRPGGSQTGIRAEVTRRLRGGALAVRDFFRKPLDTSLGIGEEQVFSSKVRALGDALYNPDWAPDMQRIRRLGTTSDEAASAFEQLLDEIVAVNAAIGGVKQSVIVATRQSGTDTFNGDER